MRIRVIKKTGPSVVVQNQDYERRVIPGHLVDEDKESCPADEFYAGPLPVGEIPWEEVIPELSAAPESLAITLRKRDIRSVADMNERPKAVQAAILEAIGVYYATLVRAAKEFEEAYHD
jgi:hypothetical protein